MASARGKQAACDRLTTLLRIPPENISGEQEGTVPKRVFHAAAQQAQVTYKSRTQAAKTIVLKAGLDWEDHFDSTKTRTKGGGNVTVPGLWALVKALEILLLVEGASEGAGGTWIPDEGGEGGGAWFEDGGQGWMLDAEKRKKVEDAAQDWLMQHYRDHDFVVTDTRRGNPYDATAEKHGAVLFLEAKGTTTQGAHILVTRNEVRWARDHQGQCVIGIWSGMRFTADGEVDPSVGKREVYYWLPEEDELSSIAYEWSVPLAKQMWPDLNYD